MQLVQVYNSEVTAPRTYSVSIKGPVRPKMLNKLFESFKPTENDIPVIQRSDTILLKLRAVLDGRVQFMYSSGLCQIRGSRDVYFVKCRRGTDHGDTLNSFRNQGGLVGRRQPPQSTVSELRIKHPQSCSLTSNHNCSVRSDQVHRTRIKVH